MMTTVLQGFSEEKTKMLSLAVLGIGEEMEVQSTSERLRVL